MDNDNETKTKWEALSPQVQVLARQTYKVLESGDNKIIEFSEIEDALKREGISQQKGLLDALIFLEECEFINTRECFYVLRPNFVGFPLLSGREDIVTIFDNFTDRLEHELGNTSEKKWAVKKIAQAVSMVGDLILTDDFDDDHDVVRELREKLEDVQGLLEYFDREEEDDDQDDEENPKKRSSHDGEEGQEEQEQVEEQGPKKKRLVEDVAAELTVYTADPQVHHQDKEPPKVFVMRPAKSVTAL